MAVNVNKVYQRVLTLANKEQRGYITPQEFNVLANQAQMDIFEQYFYDLNQYGRVRGNDTIHGDPVEILREKISVFEVNGDVTSGTTLPADLYRLSSITFNDVVASYISPTEYNVIANQPLLRPNNNRPVYTRKGSIIAVYGNASSSQTPEAKTSGVTCEYIKTPTPCVWGYNIIGNKPLYANVKSRNFELHESEESNLVYTILKLASIIIEDQALYGISSGEEIKDIQQKKS